MLFLDVDKDMNGTLLFIQLGKVVASKGFNLFWFSLVYSSTRVQGKHLKEFTWFQLPGGSTCCLGITIMK
jgi:hypothetical protein